MKTSLKNYGYATFLQRFTASAIDNLIMSLISGLFLSFGGFSISENQVNYSGAGLGMLASVAYIFYFWIYRDGQTIGKKIMGIKVVTTSNKPIDFGVALTRYIGYMISGLFLNIGYLWAIFDEKKQAWHDKIAGTYVIKTDSDKHTAITTLVLVVIFLISVGFILAMAAFGFGMGMLINEASKDPGFRQELKKGFEKEFGKDKYMLEDKTEYNTLPTQEGQL